MEKLKVISFINIKANPERVWEALVKPEYTEVYMFGCKTISDWKPGSPLLWEGSYEGMPMVFVQGYILSMDPPKMLAYSVIDPNASYPLTPENHLRVMYEIEETEDGSKLTVTQDGFETAADGDKRYRDVYNDGAGWDPILQQIKELLEKNSAKLKK